MGLNLHGGIHLKCLLLALTLKMVSTATAGVEVDARPRQAAQDPAMRTLLALDHNHDGRIDAAEVESYANDQGFDADAAKSELLSLDANGDGTLDMVELQTVLQASDEAEESLGIIANLSMDPLAGHAHEEQPEATAPTEEKEEVVPQDKSEKAARSFAKLLKLHERKTEEARGLQERAEALRKNATSIARSTHQRAMKAGAEASKRKTDAFLKSITKLEQDATDAEAKAAGLRAQSQAELTEARNLMAVSDMALKQ